MLVLPAQTKTSLRFQMILICVAEQNPLRIPTSDVRPAPSHSVYPIFFHVFYSTKYLTMLGTRRSPSQRLTAVRIHSKSPCSSSPLSSLLRPSPPPSSLDPSSRSTSATPRQSNAATLTSQPRMSTPSGSPVCSTSTSSKSLAKLASSATPSPSSRRAVLLSGEYFPSPLSTHSESTQHFGSSLLRQSQPGCSGWPQLCSPIIVNA